MWVASVDTICCQLLQDVRPAILADADIEVNTPTLVQQEAVEKGPEIFETWINSTITCSVTRPGIEGVGIGHQDEGGNALQRVLPWLAAAAGAVTMLAIAKGT